MNKSTTIIKLSQINFKYQHNLILEDINLEIKKGDFLGLVGPNGGGKTTLIKIILGLLTPNQGQVEIFGQDINKFSDWSKIGYVPQKNSADTFQFPISVKEIVALGRLSQKRFFDHLNSQDQKIIDQSLQDVDLLTHKNSLISELSGGQQQRVFIARALASQPQLLILDEPTTGVDSQTQVNFYSLLRKFNQKMGITIILISHDIEMITKEVTRVACINTKLTCHLDTADYLSSDLSLVYQPNLRHIHHHH